MRLIATAITLLVGIAALELALRSTQIPSALIAPPPESAEFVDRNGHPLRAILVDNQVFQHTAQLDQISPHLIAATLAAEDKRFFSHPGFDPLATIRAAWNWISNQQPKSGASTITQQLAKLASPRPAEISAKLREIWLALRIEREWAKDRILTEYLNRLDYGNLQRGIAAASRFYFDKPAADLSPAEAAFLAALPNAPTRLDPHKNPDLARQRQHWILDQMLRTGALDSIAVERAKSEPLRLRPRAFEFSAPHFVDLLLSREGTLPESGGRIVTSLDLNLNHQVERFLRDQIADLKDKNVGNAAAVVIANTTGEVLSLASSADYLASEAGQLNIAWLPRSPGSALKPFTAALAIENGMHPGTIIADIPTQFSTPTGLYRPNNFNRRFHGPVTLRNALGNSLNVAAIRTLEKSGGPAALHRILCESGITTLGHPPNHYGLGLTLGNGEVRLLELANAYAALARLGSARPFRLFKYNSTVPSIERRICSAETAWLVADMLSDNSARSAAFGSNSYLHFPFQAATKTGTSSDYRDNWAVGYTPEFTVAVWAGNADGSPMQQITGVTGAAPVMHQILSLLHSTPGTTEFQRPTHVWQTHVHPLTGKAVPPERANAKLEWVSHQPEWESPADYTAAGQVNLPPEFADWATSPENHLGSLVTIATDNPLPKILEPKPGTVFYLDPDLNPGPTRIHLTTNHPGPATWHSPTLTVESNGSRTAATLLEGDHTITLNDPKTGKKDTTWIRVEAL